MKKNVTWNANNTNAKRLRLFVVRTGLKAGVRFIRTGKRS